MPARKKKTTAPKTPAKKSPARKASVKPNSAKKKTSSGKTTRAKKAPARKAASTNRPAGPREQKLASSALKLVDEAAAILRQGIRTGADTTEKARQEAKRKAHTLLTKASGSLAEALETGTSALHKVLGKI